MKEKIFNCASISKLFAFLAFATAEKEGVLRLDMTVGELIPDLALYHGGKEETEHITLEMLLRHSSGLPQFAPVGNLFIPENDLERHIGSLNGSELLFEPGADSCYSNLNYDLLAYVLEKGYGCPYEELLYRLVFRRLPRRIEYVFGDRNRSQNASLGIEMSIDSLMYCVSKAFGEMHEVFFSKSLWDEYLKFDLCDKRQYYGQGLCCKVFTHYGLPCCCVTGRFMDKYICLAWNSEMDLFHIFWATGCSRELILYYHEHDLFFYLINDELNVVFDADDEGASEEDCSRTDFETDSLDRFVSCDNQVLEFLVAGTKAHVFHNLHYVEDANVEEDGLFGRDIVIRKADQGKGNRLLVLFNGETRYYYRDLEALNNAGNYGRYLPAVSDDFNETDTLMLRFLRSSTNLFIRSDEDELVINDLIHYRRRGEKYYSSSGAIAMYRDGAVSINNLRFIRKGDCEFKLSKIKEMNRI